MKVLPITIAIMIIAVSATQQQVKAEPGFSDGIHAGKIAAQQDFNNSVTPNNSCDNHGLGDQSTSFCLGFKIGYTGERILEGAAH